MHALSIKCRLDDWNKREAERKRTEDVKRKDCCPLCGQKVKDLKYYRKQGNRQLSGVVELIKAVEKETKSNRP